MNPSRRLALINAAEVARKHHAKRSHIQRELVLVTTDQLKAECQQEPEHDWPTAFGTVLHELAHLASACAIIGIVLVAAALFSGVK